MTCPPHNKRNIHLHNDDKMGSCSTNVLLGLFRLVLVLTILPPLSLAGMYRFSLE